LAISREEERVENRLDFPIKGKIETMDRFSIIQSQKIVETTVRLSN